MFRLDAVTLTAYADLVPEAKPEGLNESALKFLCLTRAIVRCC